MNSARTSSLTALAVVVISMGSCNIIGPIAYMATPEPTIDAEYLLDDRPTVVFVDERSNVLGGMANRHMVARTVSQALLDNEVVTDVIESRAADGDSTARYRGGGHADEL